jgi:RNA-directed DNA polymerase
VVSFDNFSHLWLLEQIPMDKAMLRKWLEAGYIDEGTRFESRAGTPQGGIASPVIANMALDGLEACHRRLSGATGTRVSFCNPHSQPQHSS